MRARLSILAFSILVLVGCGKSDHRYQGYVEGENSYLASPYSGALIKMLVQRGERVKKGQLLFILDPNPQTFALKEAKKILQQGRQTLIDLRNPKRPPEIEVIEAQIEQTKAQISLAEIRVKRNSALFLKHYMDKDTLDAATEHLKEVQSSLIQNMANLKLAKMGARKHEILAQKFYVRSLAVKMQEARWEKDQKNLYAPDDGIIFDTYYRRGEFVSAEHPIASLLTHENTRIEFFVPLLGLSDIHVGKQIKYTYEGTKTMHDATITYVSPEAEYMPPLVYSRDNSDKIVFRIKAHVKRCKRLIPGEPVMVTIEPDHA